MRRVVCVASAGVSVFVCSPCFVRGGWCSVGVMVSGRLFVGLGVVCVLPCGWFVVECLCGFVLPVFSVCGGGEGCGMLVGGTLHC